MVKLVRVLLKVAWINCYYNWKTMFTLTIKNGINTGLSGSWKYNSSDFESNHNSCNVNTMVSDTKNMNGKRFIINKYKRIN